MTASPSARPVQPPADFREDPLIVAMLRQLVAQAGTAMPALPEPLQEHLLRAYRNAVGERSHDARFSVAGDTLQRHVAQLRSRYAAVLASCLYSQLDRLQGREAHFPAPEGDEVGLVSDAAVERRIEIDALCRLVPADAEDGPTAFDALLCQALGTRPRGLRENPLRPAVFFHALGLAWQQASGSDAEERAVMRDYGPKLADRVNAAYPKMCATLREGLGIQKRKLTVSGAIGARAAAAAAATPRSVTGAPLPSREPQPVASASQASTPEPARVLAPSSPATIQAIAAPQPPNQGPGRASAPDASPSRTQATTGQHRPLAVAPAHGTTNAHAPTHAPMHGPTPGPTPGPTHGPSHGPAPAHGGLEAMFGRPLLALVGRMFEPALRDPRIPAEARVTIGRMQLPTLGIALAEPLLLVDPGHPVRQLLATIGAPAHWHGSPQETQARRIQLDVIVEMLSQPPADPARLASLCTLLERQFAAMASGPASAGVPAAAG